MKMNRQLVIAVDFDGTIVEHAYPRIGKPIPFAIETLKKLQEERHILVLWTVREGKLLQEAIDYCAQNGLKFYAANKNHPREKYNPDRSPKLKTDLFIDDRNIGGLPDWGVIYNVIRSGKNDLSQLSDFEGAFRTEKLPDNWLIRLGKAWERVFKK
ncbi:MAG: hypothetical protein LBN93_03840 [Candidatus Symbiothrix sp.]|jgi:hypothetical protein|nr:hypothetical protein [Candidatus Symbiothrix sp.]